MKTSAREPEFTVALMDRARREKLTIRQLFDVISAGFWSLGVIGTPAKIADLMEEWFTTGAADGFNRAAAGSARCRQGFRRAGDTGAAAPRAVPSGVRRPHAAREPGPAVGAQPLRRAASTAAADQETA